ncbi:SMI1/KNR4 family protein [Acidovorax sp. NCPPB 3859]|nr:MULTISPECIES: SMI1/KNR4 family protein [unclassified Acidovorax]MDA8451537.1 SMI1/KNR4 family protein [Acidovorax sp. GBBC 3297]MDA8461066.1 SMI1/KNR4 family protein [Acidovorax sp. GBBC 3333]MDA8466100.1 SMI1/KNR4 family protein [Acidovorax sp. GBBC 3332]MDA8471136.1 SMI1/KNR4 family protein [Acidovorax sp. GBBC 3299]WCM77349.1 SMI1/KNR4 family protein [Acidovorax sp. GBBC 712]
MSLADIEVKLSIKFPVSYKKFLSEIDDFAYVLHNEHPDDFLDDEGVAWFFWGEQRLFEEVQIEGAPKRAAWEQLVSYAEIDRSFRKKKGVPSNVGLLGFERFNKSIAIAEDNGDILYIDAAEGDSVWIYMHSSGEVKRIASSFDEWLSRSKVD